jgi:hypothetical protein
MVTKRKSRKITYKKPKYIKVKPGDLVEFEDSEGKIGRVLYPIRQGMVRLEIPVGRRSHMLFTDTITISASEIKRVVG